MSDDHKVSVIVPVYNVSPYLRDALDSVVQQTYQNLEILMIDDGSTDGSGAICDEYADDPRVTVIHQENRGLSGARNTGLDLMTGEFVAFLDSDDAFYPEAIQLLVKAMYESQADMAICNYESFAGVTGLDCKGEAILSSKEALNRLIAGKINYSVWNKIYRSELWNDLHFPEGHVYEDVEVMCHLLERSQACKVIPQPLVRYRDRKGSISNTHTEKNIQDHLKTIRFMEAYVAQHTPEIFYHDSIACFRDVNAGNICRRYVDACRIKVLHGLAKELRVEALSQWGKTERRQLGIKSKTMWFLLRYAPGTLPMARSCYRFIKRMIYREKAYDS